MVAPVVIGAAAGLAWGLATAISATSQPCNENGFLGELCSLNDLAWSAVPIGAALGRLVGWGVGELFFPARWRSVEPDGVKVRVGLLPVPTRDPSTGRPGGQPGMSLSVDVRF